MLDYYSKLLKKRKNDYLSWKPIYCVALGDYVSFNTRGFNHLRFKVDNTPRRSREAIYKMGLLPLVRPVIYQAKKIDKYVCRIAPVGGSRKKIYKEIEYWSLISVVGKQEVKIKVILRKVGTGPVHFWSVMKKSRNQKTPNK